MGCSPFWVGGRRGKVVMPVEDMFWSVRFGQVTDLFGHAWEVAAHKENLSPPVLQQGNGTAMAKKGKRRNLETKGRLTEPTGVL